MPQFSVSIRTGCIFAPVALRVLKTCTHLEPLAELALLVLEPVGLVNDAAAPLDLTEQLHVLDDDLVCGHQRVEAVTLRDDRTLAMKRSRLS